jgi:hypothetical protein
VWISSYIVVVKRVKESEGLLVFYPLLVSMDVLGQDFE